MKKILAVIMVAALSLLMAGVASADHPWSVYHWDSDTLYPTVKDKTTSSLYDIPAAIVEWSDLGTPIQPVLTDAKKGNITVSEAGSRQWLGLARIFLDDGHITKGEVKLNTGLLAALGSAAADHVACQELGHILALDHNRTELNTCMNDQVVLGSATSPNTHDKDQLNLTYNHEDVIVDNGGPGNGNGNGNGRGGRPQDGWVTVPIFPIP